MSVAEGSTQERRSTAPPRYARMTQQVVTPGSPHGCLNRTTSELAKRYPLLPGPLHPQGRTP